MTDSKYVKSARVNLGLTQKQFADKLGVSIRAVQSWEQGWRDIPNPIKKLLELFLSQKARCV